MRRLTGLLTAFAIAASLLGAPALAPAHAKEAQPAVHPSVSKAFAAAERGTWPAAHRHAANSKDPLVIKIIAWLDYQRPQTHARFGDLDAFIADNPDWPRLREVRIAAEGRIRPKDDADALTAWFARFAPLTGDGALAHIDLLNRQNQLNANRALVAQYWREANFSRKVEQAYYRRYRKYLSAEDHIERLDRLIWDQRYWPARRMLRRVSQPVAALGFARLALMRREAGVDGAIAKVPEDLRDDHGLWYERARWRRRKGKDEDAREVLFSLDETGQLSQTGRWALERRILSRRAINDGYYTEAYRLVAAHGTESGVDFAEAEFLAGWVMLTHHQEPSTAYRHFTRLFRGVNYPISRARGAYWAGRAAAEAGRLGDAQRWWYEAARYPVTFYGQRAIAALGLALPDLEFVAPPHTPARSGIADHELVSALRLLQRAKQEKHMRPFLLQLAGLARNTEERLAVVALAEELGRPREAIRAAKLIQQEDNLVALQGYPILEVGARERSGHTPTSDLILAIIRQESGFDTRAHSGAGARGMMQLMPATAKIVARSLKQPYSRDRLFSDPDYNILLGSTYLGMMLERFDGAVALALAAYNAGPHRVERWLKEYGDPRTGEISIIDWMESIPFDETRDYVQRVLEAVPVYTQLLKDKRWAALSSAPMLATTGNATTR